MKKQSAYQKLASACNTTQYFMIHWDGIEYETRHVNVNVHVNVSTSKKSDEINDLNDVAYFT